MSTNRNRRNNTSTARDSRSDRSTASRSNATVRDQRPAASTTTRRRPAAQAAPVKAAPATVTVRVRETGESITRVPVQRSGYQVVRYEGYYRTVRGGGRTPLYITFDDMNGRA